MSSTYHAAFWPMFWPRKNATNKFLEEPSKVEGLGGGILIQREEMNLCMKICTYMYSISPDDGWVHGLNKYNPTEPSRKIFMIISAMYLLCSISGVVLHFWRFTDIFAQGTRVVHVIAIMLALHNLALPCHLGHLLSTYGIWTFFGIYNPKLFKFNHLIIQ